MPVWPTFGGTGRSEGGELVNDGNGLFLTTDQNFGDFELVLDYKTVPLADSGDLFAWLPAGPNLGLD